MIRSVALAHWAPPTLPILRIIGQRTTRYDNSERERTETNRSHRMTACSRLRLGMPWATGAIPKDDADEARQPPTIVSRGLVYLC